jgi:hypothetical protein
MGENSIYGALGAGLISLIGIIIKQRKMIILHKKKQNEIQNDAILLLQESFKILNDKIDKIQSEFSNFFKSYSIKHQIKDSIELKSEQIISSNPDLTSNIKTLLLQGRQETIALSKLIYELNRNVEISESLLQDELSVVFDNLKLLCNTYFPEVRIFNNKEMTFALFLRNQSQIKNLAFVLTKKIIDYKSGVYNGDSELKYIEIFVSFLSDCYKEGIQSWRIWNNLRIC